MSPSLSPAAAEVIEALEQQDLEEERAQLPKRQRLVRCVSRPAAEFLHTLVLLNRPLAILELGTALGYSTIWIASAAQRIGATVTTVEGDPGKVPQARRNLTDAGVSSLVTTITGQVPEVLDELPGTFGFVFVDLTSSLYADVFRRMRSRVSPGALFFYDGFRSFGNWQADPDLRELRSTVEDDDEYENLLVPMEKGYLLAVRVDGENHEPGEMSSR